MVEDDGWSLNVIVGGLRLTSDQSLLLLADLLMLPFAVFDAVVEVDVDEEDEPESLLAA